MARWEPAHHGAVDQAAGKNWTGKNWNGKDVRIWPFRKPSTSIVVGSWESPSVCFVSLWTSARQVTSALKVQRHVRQMELNGLVLKAGCRPTSSAVELRAASFRDAKPFSFRVFDGGESTSFDKSNLSISLRVCVELQVCRKTNESCTNSITSGLSVEEGGGDASLRVGATGRHIRSTLRVYSRKVERRTESTHCEPRATCFGYRSSPSWRARPLLRIEECQSRLATRTLSCVWRGRDRRPVEAIAFGPRGVTLYEAGWDKVVRVWRQAQLNEQARSRSDSSSTLHVPIGPGDAGVLNVSHKSSADGNWLAVGGNAVLPEGTGFRQTGLILPRECRRSAGPGSHPRL